MATNNIAEYYIGKGVISFKKEGESVYRDLGNVPTFEFTPAIDKLEHFSSRAGVKTKDRTVVLAKSGSVRVIAENWSAENIGLAFLGDVEQDSEGDDVVSIFSSNAISGALRFQGTNEVGPQFLIELLKVDFIPGQAVSLIGDDWGNFELNGDVSAVDGVFGFIKKIADEGEDYTEVIAP